MNSIDLRGRVVVVTGGARGIGHAVAERVAASGGRPVIWDVDGAAAARIGASLDGSSASVDVCDAEQIATATTAALETHGRIDGLVCSAGIAGPVVPVADYAPDDWRRVLEVNLTGTFLSCRAVIPHMKARDFGRIVNIASIAGKEGNPNLSAYSAAKAGVIGLTKSLGKELAESGIGVNCITPCTADTPLLQQLTPEIIEYMRVRIPRGRFVEIEEIAAMVAWLLSADNSFTTAAVFDLSGGRATY